MLSIDKAVDGQKLTITLAGKLDTNTSPDLDAVLRESLYGITELIIDLKDVEYVTSAGMRVLLATHNAVSKQGVMRMRNVNEYVRNVFDMTGFSEWMIYE